MSIKRQATSNLNHENWEQEESAEERGIYKTAPQDELQKRVIRTAKRRFATGGDKPAISSFSGFNKSHPASFDFLANLTNGGKSNVNGSPVTKTDTAVSSSLFNSNPTNTTGATNSLFNIPQKSLSENKTSATQPLIFGDSSTNTTTVHSVFTSSKADSTVRDSPFTIQPATSSNSTTGFSFKPSNISTSQVSSTMFGSPAVTSNKPTLTTSTSSNASPFKTPSVSSTTTIPQNTVSDTSTSNNVEKMTIVDNNEQVFLEKLMNLNESVSAWIKKHVDESPLCILTPIFKDYERYLKEIQDEYKQGPDSKGKKSVSDNKTPIVTISDSKTDKNLDNKNLFTSQVSKSNTQSLFTTNTSLSKQDNVTDSINKTPVAAVSDTKADKNVDNKSPFTSQVSKSNTQSLFTNTNLLNESNETVSVNETPTAAISDSKTDKNAESKSLFMSQVSKPNTQSLFTNTNSLNQGTVSPFGTKISTSTFGSGTPSGFTFGIKTSLAESTNPTSTSFSFGNKSSTPIVTTTTGTSFSFGVTKSTTSTSFTTGNNTLPISTAGSTPFSFGTGKPFSFNTNIEKKPETQNEQTEDENEDTPPKVEYTPLVEENSVYDKKCKIFVKKDNNFVDKGVSTLYIKKIEDSGKNQLLVRANTSLGNILVNLILAKAIVTHKMKNNVMMICIPTPDAKPPPTTVLIRVKTSEEADELLETLNKYKT